MKRAKMFRRRRIAWLVAASALFAGCSESPDALVSSAKAHLERNEPKAAVIQLKNALQQTPDLAEARFLLGKTMLDAGDPVSADIELRKAADLAYPQQLVVPEQARALLFLGRARAVIEQFGSMEFTDPTSTASLKTTLAAAHAVQNDMPKAEAALQEALQAVPSYGPALLRKAQFAAAQRDFDRAFQLLDDALSKAPGDHEALQLKGTLLLEIKSDFAGAMAEFRKALAVRKDLPAAHAGIFQAHLATSEVEAATKQFEEMKQVLPNHPQTRLLEAHLALLNKDDKKVKEIGYQLLKAAPDDPRVLQLVGAAELRSGSAVNAEAMLGKALRSMPGLAMARRLLAQSYLRSGRQAEALELVLPLVQANPADAGALSIAGQAHLLNGDLKQAEAFFARASKVDPKDPRSRTVLALTQMQMGSVESGFAELESIAATDASVTADMALVTARMRRSEFADALTALDRLEQKQPDKPLASMLRGQVHLAQKNKEAARQSFERAAAIDPAYFPAAATLAAMDTADKKPDAARQRFAALLKADPKHMQALLAVAQVHARAGASKEEVAGQIAHVVKLHPTQAAPRRMLIEHFLRQKDLNSALGAARDAVAALPDNLAMAETLASLQFASGDINQATSAFNKLAARQPKSSQPLLQLAEVQAATRDHEAALQSARKALVVAPTSVAARQRVILMSLAAGRPQEALAEARIVQKQQPGRAIGFLLEGDVHASQKNWTGAAAAYRAALKKPESAAAASKLHTVLTASGAEGDAEKFASGWIKQHPQDTAFLFHLGKVALSQGKFDVAEARYLDVLRVQPENVVALNNVAWAMVQAKKPAAVDYAVKADKLRPNEPAIMDTLATALAENRNLPRATEVLAKAVGLAPGNHWLRLKLARMYLAADNKTAARSELNELSKLGDQFAGHEEVTRLLQGL